MYFLRDSLIPSPSSHWELLLKIRICSLGEQILSYKSTPKFDDIVSTIKVKNKNDFF